MLQEIPLNDEERAAVDGDIQALDQLLQRLAKIPTPSEMLSTTKELTFVPLNSIRSPRVKANARAHAGGR